MKVKIVIEDKKKGRIEVPLTEDELGALYDIGFMLFADEAEWLKVNKIKKETKSVFNKFFFVLNDVVYDGKVYNFDEKIGKAKLRPLKERCYQIKKPEWKK